MKFPTTDKFTEIQDRQRQVASFILNHIEQQDIAAKLGVSNATITRDVKALKKKWSDEAQQDISCHIAREIAELDKMELESVTQYYAAKRAGNDTIALRYADHRLAIKDRRAKFLGLDRPQKIELDANLKHSVEIDVHKLTDDELLDLILHGPRNRKT